MIVNAVSVRASFACACASSRRSRAISACSADGLPTVSPAGLPCNRPASRARRHSDINDEYKPSRRRNAPPSPAATACS